MQPLQDVEGVAVTAAVEGVARIADVQIVSGASGDT